MFHTAKKSFQNIVAQNQNDLLFPSSFFWLGIFFQAGMDDYLYPVMLDTSLIGSLSGLVGSGNLHSLFCHSSVSLIF